MSNDESMKRIRIKVWDDKYMPQRTGGKKSSWIDLRARGDYKIHWGELQLIRLGVAMDLPDGYEAWVVPRSSMAKNFEIIQANSIGIIDNAYHGDEDEWGLYALALKDTEIHDGDRICQFRIVKEQPPVEFEKVDSLHNISRGGFGSTGKR